MNEEDEDGQDNVDIKEMLELQLSEVEMLASMFPNKGEFIMDDPCTVPNIRSFLDGKIAYEYLHSRVGFSVKITPENSNVSVELVCNCPHEYPHLMPTVFTRSPLMSRDSHHRLNEDLNEFIQGLDRGEIIMFSVIEWIQENIERYVTAASSAEQVPSKEEILDTVFTRLWIYSHHIYSKFKRRDITDWAQELKLSGFSLPGKPGVICVEGYSRTVDEYWQRLRRLNWKRLVIKEKEENDIGDQDISKYRKFDAFKEEIFDARGGKGREYHMDLGQLYDYMCKKGCGHIFSLYFGVEGKSAAGEV